MKYALIIGNNKYDDQKLAQLKTPAADSQALAKALADKNIGAFDEVTPLINRTETEIRRAISGFLTNKKPDDLVLVYFSGHGVLDDRGRLFLSLKDTETTLLKATAIPSSFISDEMDSCRSKRQILILDCCHSGAFARGTKGEQKAVTEATFEGSGYGRVVMTASDSTQYALEGDQVISQTKLSLFTHFLLEGLNTGGADIDNDGHISLDEWYDYTYARVISETPKQIPHRWSYNQQGDLIIAKNPFLKKRIVELPYELLQALESSFGGIRESAVNELGKYLRSRDPEMAALAISALEKMKEDDSRRISLLAEKLLSEFEQARVPAGGVTASVLTDDIETGSANRLSNDAAAEVKIPTKAAALPARPVVKHTSDAYFNSSFLPKWIGTVGLGILLSLILYYYNNLIFGSVTLTPVMIFGLLAGVTGAVQYFVFRNQFDGLWIGINAIAGLLLGGFNNYLFNYSGWNHWHLAILLGMWVIGNSIFGLDRLRKPQGNSSVSIEAAAHQNIFLTLLSLALVLSGAANILLVSGTFSLLNGSWIVYGISAILAGVFIFLNRDIPKDAGFIALAVFLVADGYNTGSIALNSEYPLYYFAANAIPPLAAGIYFIFQKETWKSWGFSLLCGYLLATGLAGVTVYETSLNHIILMIATIFAFPAAAFLFARK